MSSSAETSPPAATDTAVTADPSACPRCGGKLTDPDGLGWCPACGYCRSLEEEKANIPPPPAPPAPRQPSLLGATEFGQALKLMPAWVWPLLGGSAAIAVVSVAADYQLPEIDFGRALWSAIQILLSVIGLILAQLWVALVIAAEDDKLGAGDIILPGRVWRGAVQRLPATRWQVWLGAWCLTALVCGAAVVGGWGYWLEMLKAK
jgi:hypothetical protein